MRVLVTIPYYKPAYVYGGPARSVPALCEGLAALGAEITVFTTDADGNRSLPVNSKEVYDINGVEVHYFKRMIPGNYFYSPDLASACHREIMNFNLVYIVSNWGYPFLPASSAATRSKVPFIVSPRTSWMQQSWRKKYLKKRVYFKFFEEPLTNRASAIHYTSQLEVLESSWLKLKPAYFVNSNPIPLQDFDHLPEQGLFRSIYGIPSNEKVILYLGRLEPRKGIDLALQSFKKSLLDFPETRFIIAGPDRDGYTGHLQAMAIRAGISDRVLFSGYLDDRARITALVDADVFILPSHSENFGMAIMEAMAVGLPVITSDQVGISEYLANHQAGVVAPLDPQLISNEISRLLASAELRALYGGNARRVVRDFFSPDKVASQMLEHFQRIINKAFRN